MIVITGQTATGKTKLALELAQKHNGELINFDSRQIYKYLDIITGKDIVGKFYLDKKNGKFNVGYYDIAKLLNGYMVEKNNNLTMNQFNNVKIWLYDVVNPDDYFSSFDFVKLVKPIIDDIEKRGKTPILVGGTYLYLKHLLYGIDENNSPPNFKLRDELNTKSVKELQDILKKQSLQSFNRLNHSDSLNPRRLIRKIEIELSPINQINPISPISLISQISQCIGIKYKDKNKLRQMIKDRVDERLKNGAVDEVKKLLKMGYKLTDPGMKTIGYQQLIRYLNKEFTLEKAVEDWVNKEVQYAKRQLTFMKSDKNIIWREI